MTAGKSCIWTEIPNGGTSWSMIENNKATLMTEIHGESNVWSTAKNIMLMFGFNVAID